MTASPEQLRITDEHTRSPLRRDDTWKFMAIVKNYLGVIAALVAIVSAFAVQGQRIDDYGRRLEKLEALQPTLATKDDISRVERAIEKLDTRLFERDRAK